MVPAPDAGWKVEVDCASARASLPRWTRKRADFRIAVELGTQQRGAAFRQGAGEWSGEERRHARQQRPDTERESQRRKAKARHPVTPGPDRARVPPDRLPRARREMCFGSTRSADIHSPRRPARTRCPEVARALVNGVKTDMVNETLSRWATSASAGAPKPVLSAPFANLGAAQPSMAKPTPLHRRRTAERHRPQADRVGGADARRRGRRGERAVGGDP